MKRWFFSMFSYLKFIILVLCSKKTLSLILKSNELYSRVIYDFSSMEKWLKNLSKIIPGSVTFVNLLFSSYLFQFILVAQWLVSQTSTSTGPGTKSRHGVGRRKKFCCQNSSSSLANWATKICSEINFSYIAFGGHHGLVIPPPEYAPKQKCKVFTTVSSSYSSAWY